LLFKNGVSQSSYKSVTGQLEAVEASDEDEADDDLEKILHGDDDSDQDASDQEGFPDDDDMDSDNEEAMEDASSLAESAASGSNEDDDDVEDDDASDISEQSDRTSSQQDTAAGEEGDDGDTWEDIYGRTRAKDGRILAGGVQETAAPTKYVPPALRNQQATRQPDEKKRKELERLKKQVGFFYRSELNSNEIIFRTSVSSKVFTVVVIVLAEAYMVPILF
jgi:hypothetical protein